MNIIEAIKKNREAGTPGKWQSAKIGRSVISETSVESDARRYVATTGGFSDGNPDTHDENIANAARIARVPELEEIALAAAEYFEVMEGMFSDPSQKFAASEKLSALLSK